MKPINRRRKQIIDLNTGKTYINETMAEKDTGVSRYYIHKSLVNQVPVRDQMFAYYSYGMVADDLKQLYVQNYHNKINRSNKWKNLIKIMGQSTQI